MPPAERRLSNMRPDSLSRRLVGPEAGKSDEARHGVVRRLDRGVGYPVPALPAASHFGANIPPLS
jgi:hypothetical protein